MLKSDVLT
jgi:hypothetical protein